MRQELRDVLANNEWFADEPDFAIFLGNSCKQLYAATKDALQPHRCIKCRKPF